MNVFTFSRVWCLAGVRCLWGFLQVRQFFLLTLHLLSMSRSCVTVWRVRAGFLKLQLTVI